MVVTALVPIEERALPTVEDRLRAIDVAAQLALATDTMRRDADPLDKRRRYSLVAAAALVVAVGSSLAFLARSSSASGQVDSAARKNTSVATPGAVAPARPQATSHEIVEAGAVLQNVLHADSSAGKAAASPPKVRATEPAVHRAAPAPTPAPPQLVLPSGRMPNVNVAIAGPSTDLKIVTPEMLVDARTRLASGGDAADEGDYVLARRTFRGALQQLDSLATRYPNSDRLRSLRRDLEQADARALQACNAENELHKRRGEQGKPCQ
jgi:hypothetical protein